MPNFKKSDGFSLGGNPFTMNKGSKEINTEGSFRQESTDKMGSYGSPLFAIAGRDAKSAGAAYDDSSVTDIGEAVDAGMAEGQEVREQVSPQQEANDTISDQTKTTPSKGNAELQAAKEKDTNLGAVESDSDYDNEMRRKMGYN